MSGIWTNPAFVGLVVAIPSLLLGYLAFKQSQKVDATVAQAGIATVESGTIGQVIDGLNKLVSNLQADNSVLRGIVESLDAKATRLLGELELVKAELNELNKTLQERT